MSLNAIKQNFPLPEMPEEIKEPPVAPLPTLSQICALHLRYKDAIAKDPLSWTALKTQSPTYSEVYRMSEFLKALINFQPDEAFINAVQQRMWPGCDSLSADEIKTMIPQCSAFIEVLVEFVERSTNA